jgi:hypothetical protein
MAGETAMRSRPRFWVGVVGALFLIAIFVRTNDFIDVSETMLERLQFIKSPTFRLAENTAKSNFTAGLTRMAWRRMYWGRLAARRVADEALLADIDAAWTAYINASADWNAELMIFIVGLDKYYGRKRRAYFEETILNLFHDFDGILGDVRRSRMMRKLRTSQAPDETERAEMAVLLERLRSKYGELNLAMYQFAEIESSAKQ